MKYVRLRYENPEMEVYMLVLEDILTLSNAGTEDPEAVNSGTYDDIFNVQ